VDFIIIASDGLWDVISNEVRLVISWPKNRESDPHEFHPIMIYVQKSVQLRFWLNFILYFLAL